MPAQVFHGVQGFELATATSTSAASTASGGGGLDIGALALIILGGISSGLFTTPMNFMPTWEWENVWVVYCIWGMLVLPWLLVFVTIPDLHEVRRLGFPVSPRSRANRRGVGRCIRPPHRRS
jgi:hypothetical protein